MHFCSDELMALVNGLPMLNPIVTRVRMWVRALRSK